MQDGSEDSDDSTEEFGDMGGQSWGDDALSDEFDSDDDADDVRRARLRNMVSSLPSQGRHLYPANDDSASEFQWEDLPEPEGGPSYHSAHDQTEHTYPTMTELYGVQGVQMEQLYSVWQRDLPWVGHNSSQSVVVTEDVLCRAALLALQGIPSKAFILDPTSAIFAAVPSLKVRHLSSLALQVRRHVISSHTPHSVTPHPLSHTL